MDDFSFPPTAEHASDLRRSWTQQLYREYHNIIFQFRLPLAPVVLRIEPMGSCWGRWDPQLRTIILSEALIQAHAWDIVLEVLKHEVAHQMVSEMYKINCRPHGAQFRSACDDLGLTGWAAAASGELPSQIPSWRERVMSQQDEKLLKKVQKLLSLATSSNEHEAYLAMQRVREIYARHNIEALGRRHCDDAMVSLIIGDKQKRISQTDSLIFAILVEHFFVEAIFGRQYDCRDLCEYRTVEVLGRRENVLMAEYVYHFLRQQVTQLWATYKVSGKAGAKARNSYMVGVLLGFGDKLRSAAPNSFETVHGQTHAGLVRQVNAEVAAFVQTRYPRLAKVGASRGQYDENSLMAGRRDGATITLHKAVDEHGGHRGRLLGSAAP